MTEQTRERKGDWMTLVSGRKFWPFDPSVEDVFINDIAHSLSMQCRYGGHSPRFYSVAEHSVLLSQRVSPENQLWALLHDSPETYVKDTIRPIKHSFPQLSEMEDSIMRVIAQKYGLPPEMPQEVKDADDELLREECVALYGWDVYKTWGVYREGTKSYPGIFSYYPPEEAKKLFLGRFLALI
jgi:hypothetical protein